MDVRKATREDEEVIGTVHERAVRELAAEHYDDEVLEAWTSLAEDVGEDDEQVKEREDGEKEDDVGQDEGGQVDGSGGQDTDGPSTDEQGADGDGADDGESAASGADEWQPQPENGRRVVAEVEGQDGATVAGFGDVRFDPPEYLSEPADGGVRAVYVHPDHARRGVGSALLERLEGEARDRGLESLGLLASVNAVPFYEAHGYEAVAERTFEFGGTVEGPAVEMRTEL